MRLAFFIEGRTGWMAGHSYLYNLLTAIRLCDRTVEVCLVRKPTADDPLPSRGLTELADRVLESPAAQPRARLPWLQAQLRRTGLMRAYTDKTLNEFLDGNHVDVVFGSWWQYPGASTFTSVGMCAWIHDFQFLHLPELYEHNALESTRRGVLRMAAIADRVVVSSQDALKDLLLFAPGAAPKARVMPFVANMPNHIYASDPEETVRRYHLPGKFIYLPNQFWVHKNHLLVVEALHILAEGGIRPVVVCTGLPQDSRNEAHFAEVLRQVAERGLHEQMIFLGLVPIDHVRLLMRQAICVLNPSRFEGWSSTVEEGKSLGKRLLLSDLPVHREQNPSAATFFDLQDPEDLARKIGTIWQESSPGPDPDLETMARQSLPARMCQFGELFLSIASEVAATARK